MLAAKVWTQVGEQEMEWEPQHDESTYSFAYLPVEIVWSVLEYMCAGEAA